MAVSTNGEKLHFVFIFFSDQTKRNKQAQKHSRARHVERTDDFKRKQCDYYRQSVEHTRLTRQPRRARNDCDEQRHEKG